MACLVSTTRPSPCTISMKFKYQTNKFPMTKDWNFGAVCCPNPANSKPEKYQPPAKRAPSKQEDRLCFAIICADGLVSPSLLELWALPPPEASSFSSILPSNSITQRKRRNRLKNITLTLLLMKLLILLCLRMKVTSLNWIVKVCTKWVQSS